LAPRRNALRCSVVLAGSLLGWGVWMTLFRLSGRTRGFERARGAAFAAGHALDSLRAGRSSMRWFLGASWIAFRARRLLLRLTPDRP